MDGRIVLPSRVRELAPLEALLGPVKIGVPVDGVLVPRVVVVPVPILSGDSAGRDGDLLSLK